MKFLFAALFILFLIGFMVFEFFVDRHYLRKEAPPLSKGSPLERKLGFKYDRYSKDISMNKIENRGRFSETELNNFRRIRIFQHVIFIATAVFFLLAVIA